MHVSTEGLGEIRSIVGRGPLPENYVGGSGNAGRNPGRSFSILTPVIKNYACPGPAGTALWDRFFFLFVNGFGREFLLLNSFVSSQTPVNCGTCRIQCPAFLIGDALGPFGVHGG